MTKYIANDIHMYKFQCENLLYIHSEAKGKVWLKP